MQSTSLLLMQFLWLLRARGIAYCVVGDARSVPNAGPQVGIVIPEGFLERAPELVDEFCRPYRLQLTQCVRHDYNGYSFRLATRNAGGKHEFVKLDIRGDCSRGGRQFLAAHEFLSHAIAAKDANGRDRGFMVAAPAYEFCRFLIDRIENEDLDQCHCPHLSWQWRLDAAGGKTLIERFWGKTVEARLLMRAAESGDWTAVAKLLPRMRSALHRRVSRRPTLLAREMVLTWRHWRQPAGMIVGVLGPSGSGKSSVIAAVDRRINQAFRNTAIVHLRPGFLYKPERASGGLRQAKNWAASARSACKLLAFAGDYTLGYLFAMRSLLVRSTGLIFDRYYDDVLADPERHQYIGAQAVARALRAFVPRPNLWLLLDAPASTLQSRKREVSCAESERQRAAYRQLLAKQKNVVVIDASQSFEQVVTAAATAILSHCEAQTRARLCLPHVDSGAPSAAETAGVEPPVSSTREYVVVAANAIARDLLSRAAERSTLARVEDTAVASAPASARIDSMDTAMPVATISSAAATPSLQPQTIQIQ